MKLIVSLLFVEYMILNKIKISSKSSRSENDNAKVFLGYGASTIFGNLFCNFFILNGRIGRYFLTKATY